MVDCKNSKFGVKRIRSIFRSYFNRYISDLHGTCVRELRHDSGYDSRERVAITICFLRRFIFAFQLYDDWIGTELWTRRIRLILFEKDNAGKGIKAVNS